MQDSPSGLMWLAPASGSQATREFTVNASATVRPLTEIDFLSAPALPVLAANPADVILGGSASRKSCGVFDREISPAPPSVLTPQSSTRR